MNYSNTTTYKSFMARGSDTVNGGVQAEINNWHSTSAINTIKIFLQGGTNFGVGSTFTLYGISSA